MPKIGMGKKKDVFPGRKGTSWSRTSLMRRRARKHPFYARTSGRYPEPCGARLQCGIMSVALICQLAPARP